MKLYINCDVCGERFITEEDNCSCNNCGSKYKRYYDQENDQYEIKLVDDIIIIKDEHEKKANIIYIELLERYKNKIVLTICGVSGTGKTEVSIVLQSILYRYNKKNTKIIHMDEYYKVAPNIRNKVREETEIIGPEEINWDKLKSNIDKHKKDKDCNVIIVEGIYANYLENKDFGVYLNGKNIDTYEFRKERGKENPDDEFRKHILEVEEKFVIDSRSNSDLVIPYEVD